MILKTIRGGQAELRMAEYGSSAIPVPSANFYAYTGRNVTTEAAYGMPAVSAAIRVVSETIASLPMLVYRDKERAADSWQYQLLRNRPNAEQDPFQFFCDINVSIEASGNAFIQKTKLRGRVVELHVINPDMVRVRRDRETHEKRFDIIVDQQQIRDLTSADILHIRGWGPPGSLVGFSPISLHRNVLGNALALHEWTGRYWSNDASPGMVLKVPGQVSAQQAKTILDTWSANHGGLHNAHRPAILAGGAEIQTIPFSFEDSSYIEQMRLSVLEVCRIFRIPAWTVSVDQSNLPGQNPEQDSLRFLIYSLGPRISRIEQALAHDADLFGGSDLYPEMLADSLLRPDTQTRYDAILKARQGGWLTVNEARAIENYAPVENGDTVQVTPVGGAPNLQPQNELANG